MVTRGVNSGGSEDNLGSVKAALNYLEDMSYKGISADATNQAWKMLLESKDDLENAQSFRFDLVDVARQSMSAIFAIIAQNDFVPSIKAKNTSAAQTAANKLLDLIGDFDTLLNTNENFMLGPWIQWAREWGEGQGEEVGDWYEFNARNQLTLWGPDGNINDYARKAWGGWFKTITCTAGSTSWSCKSNLSAMEKNSIPKLMKQPCFLLVKIGRTRHSQYFRQAQWAILLTLPVISIANGFFVVCRRRMYYRSLRATSIIIFILLALISENIIVIINIKK